MTLRKHLKRLRSIVEWEDSLNDRLDDPLLPQPYNLLQLLSARSKQIHQHHTTLYLCLDLLNDKEFRPHIRPLRRLTLLKRPNETDQSPALFEAMEALLQRVAADAIDDGVEVGGQVVHGCFGVVEDLCGA